MFDHAAIIAKKGIYIVTRRSEVGRGSQIERFKL